MIRNRQIGRGELQVLDQRERDIIYRIEQSQARASQPQAQFVYLLGLIGLVVSFALLTLPSSAGGGRPTGSTAIAYALLGIASVALSGFIGRMYIRTHTTQMTQMTIN